MAIAHIHNLHRPITQEQRPYGIRISLRDNDPFRGLLGPDGRSTTGSPRQQSVIGHSRR